MSARGGVEARNERDATLGCEYRGRRNPEGMALISRPQDALRRNSFRVFRVFRVLPFLGANGKSLEVNPGVLLQNALPVPASDQSSLPHPATQTVSRRKISRRSQKSRNSNTCHGLCHLYPPPGEALFAASSDSDD